MAGEFFYPITLRLHPGAVTNRRAPPLGPHPRANDNNNTVALVSCDCTLSVILDILFSALASFFPCYDSLVTSQVLSQQPRALHSGQTNRIAAEEKMSEKSGSKVGQQLAVSRLPVTL